MNGGPRIPAGPFVRWCERQLLVIANRGAIGIVRTEPGQQEATPPGPRIVLAHRLGVDVRTLSRYLNGWDGAARRTTTLSRYAVEDLLARAGEDFYEVYPEYEHERDVELEPDVWCPRCEEMTTPLHGKCLWCNRRVARARRHRHRAPRPAQRPVLASPEPSRRLKDAYTLACELADQLGLLPAEERPRDDLAA